MKKLIVVGISIFTIVLLVLGSQTNVIGYSTHRIAQQNPSINLPNNDSYSFTVVKSNADGSKEKTTVVLSRAQYNQLRNETSGNLSPDARLSVYKKYNLIPQNESMNHLKAGMLTYAKNHGFLKQNNPTPTAFIVKHLAIGFYNIIAAGGLLCIPIGTSIFAYLFFNQYFPALDLCNIFPGYCAGVFQGIIKKEFAFYPGVLVLIGFVGFSIFWINNDYAPNVFGCFGCAVAAVAVGA